MKLYKIMMEHYAPKDSEEGIYTYLAANSSEDVYEWLKSENKLKDDRIIYVNYDLYEKDDDQEESEESFRDRIIRVQGCMYDEYTSYDDLYYGKTVIGWSVVNEDITDDQVSLLDSLGIAVEKTIQ